mgnify:CR=1 FL=1
MTCDTWHGRCTFEAARGDATLARTEGQTCRKAGAQNFRSTGQET